MINVFIPDGWFKIINIVQQTSASYTLELNSHSVAFDG